MHRAAPVAVAPELVQRLLRATLGSRTSGAERVGPSRRGAGRHTTWQDALEAELGRHPLRVRRIFLSARDAAGAASSEAPLVIHRTGRGASPWLALLERRRGRVRVATPDEADRWLGADALAEQLGASSGDDLLPWALVEPELPSAQAAAPGAAKSERPPPLNRLLAMLRPDRDDLWAVVLYAVLIGALSLATPIAVQQLVNTVAFGGLLQPVVVVALLLFGGLSFAALLSALQAYTAELIQRRVFVRVVMDLAERLPRVEIRSIDRHHGPELVNRLFDVFTVQKTGALLLLDGTSVLLQTGVGLLILSFYHPLMLGFSILLIGSIALVALGFGRGAISTAISERSEEHTSELQSP